MFYVVHKGRKPGIYNNWNECKKQVDKFEGAIFKKFEKKEDAQLFLKEGFGNKKPKIITRRENDDKKNEQKIIDETFDEDSMFIYTDGSLIRGKIVLAGYGIHIPEKNINISKSLENQKITNNRAELTAIIESIDYLDKNDLKRKICIFTDSQYSMYLFTGTGERYEKDNFKNKGVDVPNIDLIQKLLFIKRKYNIVLLKVRSHTNKNDKHSLGNQIADKLANEGALKGKKESSFIDTNLSMNEMFDDLHDKNEISKCKIDATNVKKIKFKNQKLSNWFEKS